jgi:nucleoside 2-deoxyribosyltransferase
MRAYLANSLFSEADRMYNDYIASKLRQAFPDLELYLPQENMSINDKSAYANSVQISRGDDDYLLTSDFMIAVIDGVEIDSGVACEIGKYAGLDIPVQLRTGVKPRPIFALYTDTRQQGTDNHEKIFALTRHAVENQFLYRNLYVVGTIKDTGGTFSDSVDKMIEDIRKYIEDRLD